MLVLSVVIVAALGVVTWQVVVTRSQLRDTRQQLAQARAKERATASALASAQQTVKQLQYVSTTTTTIPCLYAYENSSAQYGCSPVPVLTDPTVLVQALATAAAQLTGSSALPAGQQQAFVSQFQAAQAQQESDGAQGKAWSILDPLAQAGTFVQTNDQAAVMATNAATWGGILDCMIDGGTNCSG